MAESKSLFSRHPYLLAAISCGLVVVIIALCFLWPLFFSQSKEEAIIKIPDNADVRNVKDTLSKYLGESYANSVSKVIKLRNSDFSTRHGAYKIPAGISPLKAERILSSGAQEPVMITINGFRGERILAEKLSSKLDFSQDSLLNFLKDKEFLNQYSLSPQEALALFIDDSYQVYWSSSPKSVSEKIGSHYKKIWNDERLAKASTLGLSPAEVIILASIVDEETNKTDEKGKIARLYINRLKKGMKLQADPTVKFALGDFSLRRIRSNHLQANSPYNTYKVTGLPPGPIRTVKVADIDDVLNSEPNEYLYMCAKDDFSGYHSFAKDYSTHIQNARKYQKALNRRGIK